MNLAHLHLVLNHLPVLGTGFGLALLVFGLWRRSDELKKTALGVLVLVALAAVPVYLTGEPAEDLVAAFPGVSEPAMERHERAASASFTGVLVTGVAATAGLVFFRRGKALPRWYAMPMVASVLVVAGLMAWTANLGGQIRHTEIQSTSGGEIPRH